MISPPWVEANPWAPIPPRLRKVAKAFVFLQGRLGVLDAFFFSLSLSKERSLMSVIAIPDRIRRSHRAGSASRVAATWGAGLVALLFVLAWSAPALAAPVLD